MAHEGLIAFEHCGGCGALGSEQSPLKRGRCNHCYERWLHSRAVGIGAACAACDDRRRAHLRHYEFGVGVDCGRWVVLCQNCAALAAALTPPPSSLENLRMRRNRDRRWTERRATAENDIETSVERRANDRRVSVRDIFDATDLADELLVEIEADYEEVNEEQITTSEATTGIFVQNTLPPEARTNAEAIAHSLDRA